MIKILIVKCFKVNLVIPYSHFSRLTMHVSTMFFFLLLLNKYAPIKKKVLPVNHSPFMTKTLCKAIMFRSQLKNKVKSRNNEEWSNYKKQENFCTNLLKKSKQNYFGQLDIKHLNDSRKFWKITKPFSGQRNELQ